MTALLTAFSSTASSALDCRDAIADLANLWDRLATATSEEISLTCRTLEGIPSAPNPGEHTGPVGSAMLTLCEQTKIVRQKLSCHVLELEFLGTEANTLAKGIRGLADSMPLPCNARNHEVKGYSEKVASCDTCHGPLADPFQVCPHCAEFDRLVEPTPNGMVECEDCGNVIPADDAKAGTCPVCEGAQECNRAPATVTDDPEADLALVERIEDIVKDINEERLHLGSPVAPQEVHDRIMKEVEASEQEVLAAANGHAEEPVKPTKRVRGRRK